MSFDLPISRLSSSKGEQSAEAEAEAEVLGQPGPSAGNTVRVRLYSVRTCSGELVRNLDPRRTNSLARQWGSKFSGPKFLIEYFQQSKEGTKGV